MKSKHPSLCTQTRCHFDCSRCTGEPVEEVPRSPFVMLSSRVLAGSLQAQIAPLTCRLTRLQLFSTAGEVTPDADTTTGAPGTGSGAAAADPKTLGGVGGPGAGSGAAAEEASPSSGQLYGREDRDPLPSPNPAVKQAETGEKDGAFEHPEAYPMQSDPSLPGDGASPDVHPEVAAQLPQDESSGPKAAGQGVVDDIAKKDPERYASDRSSPA